MADNETIADVIAEMRDEAARADMEQDYSTDDAAEMMREFAWRLEAAHKRERGDAAKLREALRECAQYIACVGGIGVGEVTINDNVHLIPEELTQKAIAALSASPRNCDVGTAKEQAARFFALCNSNKCSLCPCRFTEKTDCALIWAQMPYEEGGAK